MSAQKAVVVLGSTGAVGRQSLEVAKSFPDRLRVLGIGAGSNSALLSQQAQQFNTPLIAFPHEASGDRHLSLEQLAAHPEVEIVVVATAGAAGLTPTLAALEAGKTVVLANKEIMMMAGETIMERAAAHRALIIPVDRALNVIWQCLKGEGDSIHRLEIMTTASSYSWKTAAELGSITWEDVQRGISRQAGRMTRLDLATMMHEGKQLIEAHHLFGVPYDCIKFVVHPEETVPAVVGFRDGSKKSVFAPPAIRFFLQYAMSHPERWPSDNLPSLDVTRLGALTFTELDQDAYPCFKLALESARRGGTCPAVLNAANEAAALLFMRGQIGFKDIPKVLRTALDAHMPVLNPSLEDVLTADKWAREFASQQALA